MNTPHGGLLSKSLCLGLLLVLLSTACSGGPKARTFNLSVVGQTLYGGGPGGTVETRQGQDIELLFSVDEPMEVFIHGYDAEVAVKPERPAALRLRVDVVGRFPVMIHSLGEGREERRTEILLGFLNVTAR